jgi:hypothetical protein
MVWIANESEISYKHSIANNKGRGSYSGTDSSDVVICCRETERGRKSKHLTTDAWCFCSRFLCVTEGENARPAAANIQKREHKQPEPYP